MDAKRVSKMTIQDLYKDKRTRHLVMPYLKVLVKRGFIKKESDCISFATLGVCIGDLDKDMQTNMGGGMPVEGWHEMVEALLDFNDRRKR